MAGAIWLWRRAVPLLGLLGLVGLPATSAQGAENPYDGNWHFMLTPYLWLPSIDGQLTFDVPGSGGSPDFSVRAGDILENLDFAFMGTGDVRKGGAMLFTDFIYLDVSNDKATNRSITGPGGLIEIPVDQYTKTKLHGFVWTVGVGYALFQGPSTTLDVFVGFRDIQLKGDLEWQFTGPLGLFPQSGAVSETAVLWDAIIGAKGRIGLGPNRTWFIPYYFDIGTNAGTGSTGSNYTWQLLVGVGYVFQWGDVSLSYRHLAYRTENRLIEDITLNGPTLAATFRF